MLNQVLREIKSAKSPLTVHELSRKMGVEPDAMEGMIHFLVRKGLLQDDDTVERCSTDSGACSATCCGASECVFVAKMPKTYSIPQATSNQKSDQKHS